MNKEQQIIEWFENNKCKILHAFDVRKRTYLCLNSEKEVLKVDLFIYYYFCNLIYSISDNKHISDSTYKCCIIDFFILLEKYFNLGIEDVFSLLKETLIKKNRDYGNSFDKSIKKFGWIYLAIELDKKKNRLHSLLKSKAEPNYESIEDTLLDIAGYCVLALIYIDNNKE